MALLEVTMIAFKDPPGSSPLPVDTYTVLPSAAGFEYTVSGYCCTHSIRPLAAETANTLRAKSPPLTNTCCELIVRARPGEGDDQICVPVLALKACVPVFDDVTT